MVEVRSEKLQRAESKIREDGKDLHISGEPGMGKSEFLCHLQRRLEPEYTIVEKVVRRQHNINSIARDILHSVRREAPERDSKPNQVTNISAGIGPVSGGGTVDDRVRDIHKLEDLTTDWSGTPLIVCLDDIHKIADDEQTVCDFIGEAASVLGDQVHLITAGRITVSGISEVQQTHLGYFTVNQTRRFLQGESKSLSEETVRSVHSKVDGHPLYLDLLTASSESEEDFRLPEEMVYSTIEQRYIESLPLETEEFLRDIAPLPELDEKKVSNILEGKSQTEVSRSLRSLEQRVIVQEVNRTDEGDKLYKINEHFREFLVQKHPNSEDIHRSAFDYHVKKLREIFNDDSDEVWRLLLPHAFNVKHHLEGIYGEGNPEDYRQEIDRLGLTYPERAPVIIHTGLSLFNTEVISLFRAEQERFSDWLLEEAENEPVAELLVQLIELMLSQFDSEDSMGLSDVQVDASVDDLPMESEPFSDVDLTDEQVKHLRQSVIYTFSFFFEEEPYQSEEHRQHAIKSFDRYGISPEVLSEFKEQVEAVLLNSELGDQAGGIIEEYFESMETELEKAVMSSLDMYEMRSQTLKFGMDMFDSVHREAFLESGLIADIALDCGEALEQADNPAFSLLWYTLFLSYFRQHQGEADCFEELVDRFEEQLAERRSYQEGIENPIFSADNTEETVELESIKKD
ncbi:AAA family ATPase [Haloarcula onubensis]|uniref:Orc1-like AAA ATPase domain-containing protein n=1 Tax=Haloarcula onubensis TaxID=2950539 RepID=A0ABU2FUP7_9EURY|nr:AAA family ATPase [Halomicroarcula sp. S3CR25-11]MDS0283987.1 hypothetical protein [Halomicroarcula sp. S3CR25-11]